MRVAAERLLNNEHQQQLSPTHLRAFDQQRTALVQFRFGLEQKFLFLVKLQIQNVATWGFTARVYVQAEKFARRKPIFLTGLKGFLRLSNDLKFVVAEKLFQQSFNPSQFRRNRLRLRHIFRDDKSAPNFLGRLRRGRRGHRQDENRDYDRQRARHEQLFRGVIGR